MESKIGLTFEVLGIFRDGGTREVKCENGNKYYLSGSLPQDGIVMGGVYDKYPMYNKGSKLIGYIQGDFIYLND